MPKWDFWGKRNTNGFDKNPQNIVPWRPRKWINLVNQELEKAWFSPATRNDIEVNYMSMINLPEEELKELLKNKGKPMMIRILAKSLLSWKWFEIVEKMLDRGIWKAIQREESRMTDVDGNDLFKVLKSIDKDVDLTKTKKKVRLNGKNKKKDKKLDGLK